jgi:hypothetical protein
MISTNFDPQNKLFPNSLQLMKPSEIPLSKSLVLLPVVFILLACDSSEDPGINCAVSGLAVTVTTTTNSICGQENGSITVSGTGGMEPFMFSLNGGNFQSSGTFDQVGSGSYTVQIKDDNGCTASVDATVEDETTLAATVSSTKTGCGETSGSLNISATGGSPGYMYKIDNAPFQASESFTNLGPGNYTVTVTDAEGCETSLSHRLLSTASWAQHILPIINTRCALSGCHDGNSGLPNWTDLATVQQNAQRIKSRTGAREMPPAGAQPLTENQISMIACWVDDGAMNN